MMVVRPVPKENEATSNDSKSNTVDFASIPRVRFHPLMSETSATAGIVKPILASAEPNARLRLVCKRLALAA